MKYRTKQPIKCGGKLYKPDTIIELSPKQARNLGDYVVPIPEKVTKPEKEKPDEKPKKNSNTNIGDSK